jgi:hypothetical protein
VIGGIKGFADKPMIPTEPIGRTSRNDPADKLPDTTPAGFKIPFSAGRTRRIAAAAAALGA